jgi:hypothetical protein
MFDWASYELSFYDYSVILISHLASMSSISNAHESKPSLSINVSNIIMSKVRASKTQLSALTETDLRENHSSR